MSPQAETFNWVKAHSECSISKMFSMLETEIKADVEVRMEISRHSLDGRSFEFHAEEHAFMVSCTMAGIPKPKKVEFNLKEDSIEISGHGAEFSVSVWVNAKGSCIYVNLVGEQMESWRVRRMALNTLFFGNLNDTTI